MVNKLNNSDSFVASLIYNQFVSNLEGGISSSNFSAGKFDAPEGGWPFGPPWEHEQFEIVFKNLSAAFAQSMGFQNNFINGMVCHVEYFSHRSVQVQPGVCRSSNAEVSIYFGTPKVASLDEIGPNGRDHDVIPSTGWYYVFAISQENPVNVATLLSKSFDSPSLPAGYKYFRRVCSVYFDFAGWGLNHFVKFKQYGNGNYREVRYDEEREPILEVLTDGSDTSPTPVDCSRLVPPHSSRFKIQVYDMVLSNVDVVITPNDYSYAGLYRIGCGLNIGDLEIKSSGQGFEYNVNAFTGPTPSVYIQVLEYIDEV